MPTSQIGIEWVNDYHSAFWPDLKNCQEEAERFRSRLNGTPSFSWGNDMAWDQDFEEQGASFWHPTGKDSKWADNVDIVFYSGHGESAGPRFGDTSHDQGQIKHAELRLGNVDLEWAIFDCCFVLEDGGDYWKNSWDMFQGLHYMFGFHTKAGDDAARGEVFADYLNSGETMRHAWIKACQDTESSSRQWGYLRASSSGTDTYNEKWFSAGTVSKDPDPNTQTIYYLRGAC